MATNVTKFMVIVETKNYPVLTTRPTIQRYAKIRKKMNASEIAQCLTCHATVTLEKNNGSKIKLTADNFKDILRKYTTELNNIEINKGIAAEEAKNTERLEKIKEEPVVEEKEEVEQIEEYEQPDQEDPDVFTSAPYYEGDE